MKIVFFASLGANFLMMAVIAFLGWRLISPDPPVLISPADTEPVSKEPAMESPLVEVTESIVPMEIDLKSEPQEPSSGDLAQFLIELEDLDMRVVPNRILDRLNLRALDGDAQVTDELRDLFSLGEEETERLNRVFGDAAQRLRQLELRNMEVESLSDTQALVRIAPLGPDAQILHDELRQAVDHELGDIDGTLFWDLMKGSNHQAFWSGFGEHGIELDLTVEPDESGNIGMSLRSKPITSPYPVNHTSLNPGPSEEAEQRLEHYLKRQIYIIDHLPEHMRALLVSGSPE